MFYISGQNVNFVEGGPKNWHTICMSYLHTP